MVFVADSLGKLKVSFWNAVTVAAIVASIFWRVSEIKAGVEDKVAEIKQSVAVLDARFATFLDNRSIIDAARTKDLKDLNDLLTQVRIEVSKLR